MRTEHANLTFGHKVVTQSHLLLNTSISAVPEAGASYLSSQLQTGKACFIFAKADALSP